MVKNSEDEEFSLLTSSEDNSIQLKTLPDLELKCEYYIPKKKCLTMDVCREAGKAVIGYSDGYIRVFDYKTQKVLGQFPLTNSDKSISLP